MPRFFVRDADERDDRALRELAELALEGRISLSLARTPSFFTGAAVQNEVVEISVICDRSERDRVVASVCTGRRREFVDGKRCWVRYLSDVRIAPGYRGGALLRVINDHVVARERAEPSAMLHAIMFSDNDAIRGTIRRRSQARVRRMGYLWFHELGTYRTSAVSLRTRERRHRFKYHIRRAGPADAPAMQTFFDGEAPAKTLYPAYRFDRLDAPYYTGLSIGDYFLAFDGDNLVGMTGVWDQRPFKQTRIAGYAGALRWSRPVANVLGRLATGFSLPPAGTELAYFYLHTIVTKGNSPDIFRDLAEHIHGSFRSREHMYFLCGLFIDDPLVSVLDCFRTRRDITAEHYQVCVDGSGPPHPSRTPAYLEAARI